MPFEKKCCSSHLYDYLDLCVRMIHMLTGREDVRVLKSVTARRALSMPMRARRLVSRRVCDGRIDTTAHVLGAQFAQERLVGRGRALSQLRLQVDCLRHRLLRQDVERRVG